MTIGSFTGQLAMRFTVIALILATVGGWSYEAKNWNSATRGAESSNTAPATR